MNKRILFYFLCLWVLMLGAFTLQAANTDNEIERSIHNLRLVLNSREWEPVDSVVYERINALIGHIENPTLDSLISLLKDDTHQNNRLFVRKIDNISNPENVKGFITNEVVNRNIENIEKDIRRYKPVQSIVVPETEFVGMYSKLNLIPRSDLEKMLAENLVTIPDELLVMFSDPKQYRNADLKERINMMRDQFLDSARVAHNNKLIEHYRDSVANAYRENQLKTHIDSVANVYLVSVKRSNTRVLTLYNEIKTAEMNQEILESLNEVIYYANSLPNELTIINLNNELTHIYLQNNEPWYTWLFLKNQQNDSVGIRVEGLNRQTMRMLVDESMNLSRLTQRQRIDASRLIPQRQTSHRLVKLKPIKPIHVSWKLGGRAYTGFTETYINDFWAKGGVSSASILTTLNYFANYSKDNINWDNNLETKLGMIYYFPRKDEKPKLRNYHKNSDNLNITSRLGFKARKNWFYSTDLEFKTQLLKGYRNNDTEAHNSSFLSPANFTFSVGMAYKEAKKDVSLLLSPVSLRTTIVTDPDVNRSTYGMADDENIKSRIGSNIKYEQGFKISKDVSIKTKNDMFVNFGKNELGEALWLKFPDIDTETNLNFKVNQFVTTQVNLHMIYNKDVKSAWKDEEGNEQKGTRLQVKQFLTLGFNYRF